MGQFARIFRHLPDPRADNARHELLDVLFIALAAVLCGAKTCADMADFGESKEELLRLVLRLEHGIPSHDTFSRVSRLIEPKSFERMFSRFMAAFAKANGIKLSGVVAIDGKAVRGAYERGGKATPMHLVNVFAVDARMALAQQKAPGRNETAGALEVLDLLDLKDSIVTADALHCTRAFAAAVLERGGDYALAIKANRRPLFEAVTQQFTRSGKRSSTRQIELSTHDRSETRSATVIRNTGLAEAHRFPGLAAIGRVTLRRRMQGQHADNAWRPADLLKVTPWNNLSGRVPPGRYAAPKNILPISRRPIVFLTRVSDCGGAAHSRFGCSEAAGRSWDIVVVTSLADSCPRAGSCFA
jgi:predicted transposase YbfD/YdcC